MELVVLLGALAAVCFYAAASLAMPTARRKSEIRKASLFEPEEPSNELLKRQVEVLQDHYSPKGRIIDSWFERKAAEQRSQLASALTMETVNVSGLQTTQDQAQIDVLTSHNDLKETPDRLDRKNVFDELMDAENIATKENNIKVTNDATERGDHSTTYIQLEAERQRSKILEAEKDNATKRKIREHKKLKGIDYKISVKERELDAKAAIVANLVPQLEAEMLKGRLFGVIDQIEALELMPKTKSNKQKMRRLKKDQKMLEAAIDEREAGLIQGDNRNLLSGLDEES
jgi:hypothetical protein